MNKNIKNLFLTLSTCLFVLAISSCGNQATLDGTVQPASGARVKFFNAVAAGNPLVVTQNGSKWTSVLTTAKYTDSIAVGSLFPAIDYTTLPAGSVKFTAKYPFSTLSKDTTVSELTQNLENDKYYLLLAADSFPTPKLYMIPDERNDATRKSTKTYFRFSNFLMKAPASGYEYYINRQPTTPFATLKYAETSPYIEFEPAGTANDTVFVRTPGTTTNKYTFVFSTTKFAANRTYIVITRGVDGGTGTKAPTTTLITTN